MNDTTRKAPLPPTPQRGKDRRVTDRRKVNLGPPPGTAERRQGQRRSGKDRRKPR